jgi:hypothetical protein
MRRDSAAHVLARRKAVWSRRPSRDGTVVAARRRRRAVPQAVRDADSSDFGIRLFDQQTKQPRAFTLEEINALQKGTKYAAVFGMIVYNDQFGIHWYRFCAWNPNYGTAMGSANASECVAWNVAGDGKPDVPFEKE